MSLQIEYLPITDLKPYENNARHHEDADVSAIVNSIKEFGFDDPIGVWGDDNTIIEGHGRLMAAKKLKMKEVPCIRLDHLTDEQRRAYALAHNKTAELSEWDLDLLKIELDDITDIDMSEFGFDLDNLGLDEIEINQGQEQDEFEDIEKLDTHYGVPYQGNKSRIADKIISVLPEGKRLVDLFGGGGAITHCGLLSEKWEKYLYNDINERITGLFMDAVNGKYKDEHRVITREDFEALKDKEAYVAYIWSFGNAPEKGYLWGKHIERIKCEACHAIMDETIQERRLAYVHFIKMLMDKYYSSDMTRLQSIEHLEALQRLQSLQSLQISNIDYHDFSYQDGDIVYCDPPYEQTNKKKCDDYSVDFDSIAFYEWVKSRDYQVYFSSYEISDDSFYKIKIKDVASLIGATTNGKKVTEYLYSNRPIKETPD